jgi:hypothetical protein
MFWTGRSQTVPVHIMKTYMVSSSTAAHICNLGLLAGTGGIVSVLLQQGVKHLKTHLCCICRACRARGYMPKAWRQIKLMFIPKPRKANYIKAKAHCPTSLSSFMLITMEKLVDRHIRVHRRIQDQ